MVRGNVSLNSVGFVCDTFEQGGVEQLVHRERKEPFATAFRTTGQQRQGDLTGATRHIFRPPINGHGVDRASDDLPFRCLDATCETRWGVVTLPLETNDATEADVATSTLPGLIRASSEFNGQLVTFWGENGDPDDISGQDYTASTNTWTHQNRAFLGGATTIALDSIVSGDKIILLVADDDEIRSIFTDDHTTSWTIPNADIGDLDTGVNVLLANVVTTDEDIDAGLLAEIGGEVVAIVWNERNGVITFYSTTDQGNNWADEAVDINSGGGVKGVVVTRGTDGLKKLLVGTREGIWEVDTAPGTWTVEHIWKMSGHDDNCRKMTIGPNGTVWFFRGVSDNEPFEAYEIFVSNSQWAVSPTVGSPHLVDGLVSDRLGTGRWMKTSGQFMYISVGGGAASHNASIYCHNGRGWHSIYKRSGANVKIEWIDVSIADGSTLKLLWSERDDSATSDTKYIDNPNSNPTSGVSLNYSPSGFVDWSRIDNGMPLIPAAWLQIGADVDDLSADTTGEYIAVAYGKDGEARTTNTDLSNSSNFESDAKTLIFNGGAGVSSNTMAFRTTFNQDGTGDPTDTPSLFALEVALDKHPAEVERFTFLVNIEETAEVNGIPPEAVITNLETARDLDTLPQLDYANMGVKYVRVKHLGWREGFDVESAPDTLVQRIGSVLVVCEEII